METLFFAEQFNSSVALENKTNEKLRLIIGKNSRSKVELV